MNESEKLEIFHKKERAELDDSERILALRCACELLDEPLHAFTPDFLKDSFGCLTISRSKGALLCFFFKSVTSFLENFWRVLNDYTNCSRHRRADRTRQPHSSGSGEDLVNVLVFVPRYEASWMDFLTQVRVPIQLVPYMIVSSRNSKAIVLEVEPTVIFEGILPTGKQSFDVTEAQAKKVGTTGIEGPTDDSGLEEAGRGLPESRTASGLHSESFFQRAKLTSEEIRALLDFEMRLEEIKTGV